MPLPDLDSFSLPSLPALDLGHLSASAIADFGQRLAPLTASAQHRQAAAERIVGVLYNSISLPDSGQPACALIRCFQTCPYARLPLDYQHAADSLLAFVPSHPDLRCLSLLATRGARHVWNSVATSINHQSIPLPSVEVVKRAPMIARMLEQIGIPIERLIAPPNAPDFVVSPSAGSPEPTASSPETTPSSLEIFHVAHASGSPFIPAQQEFVEPFGVRSVLGLGGLLPDGELFVVILFTRIEVSRETAALFPPLALAIQSALQAFPSNRTFQGLDV